MLLLEDPDLLLPENPGAEQRNSPRMDHATNGRLYTGLFKTVNCSIHANLSPHTRENIPWFSSLLGNTSVNPTGLDMIFLHQNTDEQFERSKHTVMNCKKPAQ